MAPKIVDPEERRFHIATAAAGVFAEKGFQAATMSDIAARAGIGKGTLYIYFKSKQEIFIAIFEGFAARMAENSRAAITSHPEDARASLTALARHWASAIMEALPVFSLVMEFWAAASIDELREIVSLKFQKMYNMMRLLVIDVIEQGQEQGVFRPGADAWALATMFIGAMDGLGLQVWFDQTIDPHRAAEGFLDTLFRGLEAGPVMGGVQ